jgi:hypothetical protein
MEKRGQIQMKSVWMD